MPKVNAKAKRPAKPVPAAEEPVSISSVFFGLAMIAAIIVATAAWMGGSMSKVERHLANLSDGAARALGLAVTDVAVIGLETDPALAEAVRAAAMVEPGENMWRADPHAIRTRLLATNQVVNVRVHRLWPDQLLIMADPADAVALWHDGAAWQVVDALGRVMPGAVPDVHAHLPRFAGAGAPEAVPQAVAALAAHPEIAGQAAHLTRIADRRWDLQLESGAVVRLPGDDRLEAALAGLDRLDADTGLLARPLAIVDLRLAARTVLVPAAAPSSSGGAA